LASDISGGSQVGRAVVGGISRASLWSGTSVSWVDLHPAGASASNAHGVFGSQQVGTAEFGATPFASLWNGTPASWVNLNPAGAVGSEAFDTSGTYQVGWAKVDGIDRASFWSGSAASWQDLSLHLPGSWGATYANGVWDNGTNIYISGFGFNNLSGRNEALLWKSVPEPSIGGLLVFVGCIAGLCNRRRPAT
jgi:hypothetical protein